MTGGGDPVGGGIEHLDFTPGPVMCGCGGCPAVPHSAGVECGSVATHVVRLHGVNQCDDPELALTDGWLIRLVCRKCLAARVSKADQFERRLRNLFRRYRRPVVCSTCGVPLVDAADFFRVGAVVDG